MRITPLDIQQKTFPTQMLRGFDQEEVYSFLELVREELEEVLRENASLKEQLSRADSQLQEYNNMNNTLKETLITTQQMVDEFKANARKEAELILRDAESRADDIIKAAQEKAVKIHEDIVELKGIRRHFKEEVKRLIESHMKMVEFDKEREEAE
ncbi:MAG TPA: DivIVA domain-containing protein [Dissulfurispiraceae bacterium]|nr:DivIVA domain-containing protein [Dissulfurispiraceae bacterium]